MLVITDSRDGKEKWKKALEEKWASGAKGRKIFTHLKPTSNLWKILISCRRLKEQQKLLIITWPLFDRAVSIDVWKSNYCLLWQKQQAHSNPKRALTVPTTRCRLAFYKSEQTSPEKFFPGEDLKIVGILFLKPWAKAVTREEEFQIWKLVDFFCFLTVQNTKRFVKILKFKTWMLYSLGSFSFRSRPQKPGKGLVS